MSANKTAALGLRPNAAREKTPATTLAANRSPIKFSLKHRRGPFPCRSFRLLQRDELLQTFIDLGSQP